MNNTTRLHPPTWASHEYREKCSKCLQELTLWASYSPNPEYYHGVYVQCPHCGGLAYFNLPVN